MIPRNNHRSQTGALSVPLSMIDVAWLVLMFALVQAEFLVESVALPDLLRTEVAAATEQGKASSQIALHKNGEVTYQGEPIALEEVPARINAESDQSRPVLLSIETNDATQALVQLMHDLSQSGMGHRVQVQYAKPKASTPQ